MESGRLVREVHSRLHDHYGRLDWWTDDPLEVLVGAILTQRTVWRNAERAIRGLRNADLMDLETLAGADRVAVGAAIRTSGTFRQKAGYLIGSSQRILEEQGDLSFIADAPFDDARRFLLSLPGVGPETADSVLLYGGDRPVFVIDAYTLRTFSRLGLDLGRPPDAQRMFMDALAVDADLFRQYHAMIVEHGKSFCRSVPRCNGCPLSDLCHHVR